MRVTPQGPETAPQASALQTLVEVESAVWVNDLIESLESAGRPIEGGWPGTISEARRRVVGCLVANKMEPVKGDELAVLVDTLYSEAKRLWLVQRY